jgi:hypothetical protein
MEKNTNPAQKSVKAFVHDPGKDFSPTGTTAFTVTTNVSHFTLLRITGISLPNGNPFAVLATVRAPGNDNPGFSDSFALTVNEIHPDSLTVKIWRVDSSDDPSAPIRIDFFVVL